MCLLVVEDFDSLVPCLKIENDVKLCLSTWVTLCLNWLKGMDIKSATSVSSCCLRHFGAPSGRAYAQYRLCNLFMTMKHICDDISYDE